MKILYIYVEGAHNSGVIKKIQGQVKALEKLKNEVDVLSYRENTAYLNNKKLFYAGNKYMKRFIMFFRLKKYNLEEYDLIYLRNPGLNPFVNYFLKNCKTNYKKQKIILEIPTYPYDGELFNFSTRIHNFIDRFSRKNIKKYIDRIVTYSTDKIIFDIPCINISNGIDFEELKIVEKRKHEGINFIMVSLCFFWHGIDRFLYSILNYKKNGGKEKIRFHIVGEGKETPKLKNIVENNLELHDVVIFHGFKSGKELDSMYDETDIALGSLGRFRSGLITMKPLKNREYAAKGLPMIYSEIDLDFENKEFVYKVSHDEQLINIEEIITWYKNLKISSEEIRQYSKKFSWESQMKKVFDEVKEL